MPPPTPTRYTTVAFSGAGHLLAYHLGVASTLLTASTNTPQPKLPPLRAVSGSSSGAIAAAVLSCLPHRPYWKRLAKEKLLNPDKPDEFAVLIFCFVNLNSGTFVLRQEARCQIKCVVGSLVGGSSDAVLAEERAAKLWWD